MISLGRRHLGGGVGRRLCMPIYSGSSDSVFKDKNFVLKKINHKYENVLLFGDVNKLRDTAIELIRNISSTLENVDNNYKNCKFEKYAGSSEKKSTEMENENNLGQDDYTEGNEISMEKGKHRENKPPQITKKLSFWQIYSMRVKKSLHLMNPHDFALILQSFHLHNKDTGIYVSSVRHIEGQIPTMNGLSFVILLTILSKRLKKNNYNEFFKKMMNYLPNIMYELNVKDMYNILTCFYNLELSNTKICEIFYMKILANINNVDDASTISSLCHIFYKYNFTHLHFFERLKKRGLCLLNNFDAMPLYIFIFSLYKMNICVKEIVERKKNDIYMFFPNYNEEQKLFMCDMFGIK
ncbi:conserved Plasmodium protein, unknown function [Plasmodium ovale]|uniref:Uncharacterized protein n=1 Tax=Plasmodium ovale TaxID=36330 RepID=A0A1D3U965_PLAOA|nr:conserved Plasmodium protein, unknown function [Plasmodium ovale]